MKDYQDVVNDRFEKEAGNLGIYSADNPIGKYISSRLYSTISEALENLKLDKSRCRIVDIGCGEGILLKKVSDFGYPLHNLYGIDLSENRIEVAKKNHPEISFQKGNIVSFELKSPADIIITTDVLSHLKRREDIICALRSVKHNLSESGYFLWYDIHSGDHFKAPQGVDSWGFNEAQMEALANEAGLKLVSKKTLFRRFFNRYHSAYQAGRIPAPILKMMEKILPGSPGNLLMSFQPTDDTPGVI